MSLGRYGADDPRMKKVSLEVTVDSWVSESLGKIRSKKSVSSLVNSLLGTVIRQFDPGPSAPMIYDLVSLLAKHRKQAEETGDAETLAAISQLHSELEPYIDLAEAEPEELRQKTPSESGQEAEQRVAARNNPPGGGKRGIQSYLAMPPAPVRPKKDYDYYAVPIIHCEKPMVYLRDAKMWKCFICGYILHDT